MAKRTTSNTTSNTTNATTNVTSNVTSNVTTTSIMAAAQRVATRRTAADHKVMTAKAVRPLLQEVKLVRTGGNAANGLLAIGGASLVINQQLAQQQGATVGTLLPAVAACPRVQNAVGKTSDHLQNCIAYSAKARLAVCGAWAALRSAGLVTVDGQATVPALCVDGKPVPSMTRKQLSALPSTAILTSPLLAAIAALTTGKQVPAWVKATLPSADNGAAKVAKKTAKASKAAA